MRVTGWLRRNLAEVVWGGFAVANLVAIFVWPGWVRLPFYLIWVSLAFVYGFRLWSIAVTSIVLLVVSAAVVAVFVIDGFQGDELSGKLVAVPFLAAMFATMVWHVRRRTEAVHKLEAVAGESARLLERQQSFLQDASHELRTPVTIARGHLELLQSDEPELRGLDIALDELARIERIVERLLLLAQAENPHFLSFVDLAVDSFLEDVFMRWSEVAPRAWRLELDVAGRIRVDEEAIRTALDALLENAVRYTEPHDAIELRAWAVGGEIVIEVADEGCGVPPDKLDHIFDRFARADAARTRDHGGVGLGLAIVHSIAKAHGGSCSVKRRMRGTIFALHLPVGPATATEVAPGLYALSRVGRDDSI